uniref:NADH dehydrogenase subunit 6 n=1 Tax=Amblyomma tholloni TaxID=1701308 RepID=UPI002238B2BE|nr:NADH dehydrogenase subunit 6 [Amblyomma tholloni]QLD97061.1 NADH dehydrogenase subunit 6 [Amblyomma tholloni]QLD97074.1 NADH dehydrogenase subunit 6 [Amblyomma tholloni]UYB78013.1 NADH dehydrogenase subunit 6 [Amblyomma tholloni]
MNIILFFSILLISMSHPVTMLLSVILLTLAVSMIFYQNSCNSLLPLILILLILGGMLIIFMYMVSLCPNKKINFNIKNLFMILLIIIFNYSFISTKIFNQDFMKIYFNPFFNMMLLTMIYLLISLLVVMKMLNWISCPMKSQ